MNFKNYTIKSQEVLQNATEIASSNQHQVIETGHLTKAILQSDESLISLQREIEAHNGPFFLDSQQIRSQSLDAPVTIYKAMD